MLQILAALGAVMNTGLGLGLAVTRGGLFGRMGLPPPAPFYADLLAVFLVGSGVGFALAALDPQRHRGYLWTFGVGVKLVAAALLGRVWLAGLAGWLTGASALADATVAVLLAVALLRTGPRL
jgi:hypothetical protein